MEPEPEDSPEQLANDAAVGDFVEMWRVDQQAGTERTLGDYLARFPGFEAAIAREYLTLVAPSPILEPFAGHHEFGTYRTIRLLGQGGQGSVWLAEDTRLHRRVALKVLSAPAAPVLRSRVERLRREAMALAKLAHPGICAIYEAQLDGAQPFLAMQYVAGETLATWLHRREASAERRVVDRGERLAWIEFFKNAAAALHAAHTLGIVHRDVKPGNVMRTASGAPVLLDFGFARDLEANPSALTQSGEMFGTLPYMAPEVLAGRPTDHRVDIHALAVTMYEVLAGRRPFVGATQAALRQAIESGEPEMLDRVSPSVGRDLAVVVATAMEHDAVRRYATAEAFAEDLRRVLVGEPIAAAPVSQWTRLQRLVVRHPAMASSCCLLAAGLLVAIVLLAQLSRERTRLLALRQAHLAQQIAAKQPGLALFAASEAAQSAEHPEINEVLYQVLDDCWEEHAVREESELAANETNWACIAASDRELVRSLSNGDLQVVDLERGRVVRTIHGVAVGRTRLAILAGDAVVTGDADGVVRRRDLATGAVVGAWPVHAAAGGEAVAVSQIVAAPDGHRVASCGSDGKVAVIDLGTNDGAVVFCRGHTGGVTMGAFDPSGQRLATLGGSLVNVRQGDRCVRVFAADTGELQHTFGPFEDFPYWVSWSHDGAQLAIARNENCVEIRDAASGAEIEKIACPQPVHWAEFAPGDERVVFGSSAGLGVYDLRSHQVIAQHADFQERSVFRGAFSPDGKLLAVIAWDDTARIYDTATWQLQRVFHGLMTRALGLGWNRRGDRLYTMGGCLQSWYVGERPFLPVAKGLLGRLVSARFSPHGDQIVAANAAGEVRIWDGERCHDLGTIQVGTPVRDAVPTGAGARVLVIGDGVPSQLVEPGKDAIVLGGQPATAGWLLADGRIALVSTDGVVRVHDGATGGLSRAVPCHTGSIVASALHPTRPWLATGGCDRSFALVDLDRGEVLFRLPPWTGGRAGKTERVFAVAFSPSGSHLFASCEDLSVRELDLEHGFAIRSFATAPTPGLLLVSGDSGALFVGAMWSGKLYCHATRTLGLLRPHPARHANLLVALARQPDGPLALSASKDGVVSIFDADRDELISVIHATKGVLATACWSPDGQRILTADVAGLVRVWPLDPLGVALRFRPTRLATDLQDR